MPAYDLVTAMYRGVPRPWHHVNYYLHATLSLAIRSKMDFEPDEISRIYQGCRGDYWFGDHEGLYAIACGGSKSAAVAMEHFMQREPFIIDDERVYVDREFVWDGDYVRCTSIEADFVRVKRKEKPQRVFEIPREGVDAILAAKKEAAKAQRAAQREATRADPVPFVPLAEHLAKEVKGSGRGHVYIPADMAAWAAPYGADYERAYRECPRGYWLLIWMEGVGRIASINRIESRDVDALRKRYTWPKMEQAIFRRVRAHRGLPLKGQPEATTTPSSRSGGAA